jgi:hypothetical protein
MELVLKLNDFYAVYERLTRANQAPQEGDFERLVSIKEDICDTLENRIPLRIFKEPVAPPGSPSSRRRTQKRNASPARRPHLKRARMNARRNEYSNLPVLLPDARFTRERYENLEGENIVPASATGPVNTTRRQPRAARGNIRSYFGRS